MISWSARSPEERNLLNPCFTSMVIWHAARGCAAESDRLLSLEETFLVLPTVLHERTRNALPTQIRTSLAVWCQQHPIERGRIADRSRHLVPYTREALVFGGQRGAINLDRGSVDASAAINSSVSSTLRNSSLEVQTCARKALFVGRWFGRAGGPATVMALLGVRP